VNQRGDEFKREKRIEERRGLERRPTISNSLFSPDLLPVALIYLQL
jgi:hypothetical protein